MIEVIVESIRVNLVTQNRVVILKELDGERHLPIWIGDFESQAIAMWLQKLPSPRPLPYDVTVAAVRALGATVVHATIDSLREEVFYSTVVLAHGDTLIDLDARPSDAIALALRFGAPIVVAEEVLAKAGVKLDETSPISDAINSANRPNQGPSAERAVDDC